jgi:hypothetical protein
LRSRVTVKWPAPHDEAFPNSAASTGAEARSSWNGADEDCQYAGFRARIANPSCAALPQVVDRESVSKIPQNPQ